MKWKGILISSQQDTVHLVQIVKVCCILYNWLVSPTENIPENWMDNGTLDKEDDSIGVPRGTTEGNARQEQILGYILEFFGQ